MREDKPGRASFVWQPVWLNIDALRAMSHATVLADCNVAIVRLHCCGQSFVYSRSLVCQLTCVVVSVSVIRCRFCSSSAVASACCLIAEGLKHLSVTKPVGVQKANSSHLVYFVEFHQPLACV